MGEEDGLGAVGAGYVGRLNYVFHKGELTLKLTLLALLIPAAALAGNAPKSPASNVDSRSSASAHAGAAASSRSTSTQSQSAHGGEQSQTAEGGSAEQSQSANNEGVTTSVTTTYRRQAPSVAQGSLMVGSCGSAGNGGGSNSRGAAFLGLAWTPADCKLLLAASAYQALGMYDSACEMVNGISAVRKRWEALGVEPPSCEVTPPDPVAQPATTIVVQPADTAASEARMVERMDRIAERAVGGGK